MQRLAIAGIVVVILPSLGLAHVSVRPRESKAGAEERYVVRVPTEGTVATDYCAARWRGRLDVCECRILQAPSSAFMRTSVSSPPESISLSDILALIVYSDVAYADRPPGRSITLVFLCANWRFSNPLSSGPR